MFDPVHAFCPDSRVRLEGRACGPLHALTFAAKDVFDIAGHVTGFGNPTWLATHSAATRTARCVAELVGAGATLVGKTATEELAFSLTGVNAHYGTPTNPAAPGRIPGGSSSGSAAAVAASLVDFAIGTDTGGSVRVPASYCGIWGFRPTHGRVSLEGVLPLAPSFDAVGWFAREGTTMARVADVLLRGESEAGSPRALWVPDDVLAIADGAVRQAFGGVVSGLAGDTSVVREVAAGTAGLGAWAECFRVVQGWEAWQAHGAWIETTNPTLGAAVRGRFDLARRVTRAQAERARGLRHDVTQRLCQRLGEGSWMVFPTTPGIAPLIGDTPGERVRGQVLALTSMAGLAGLPQVSIPLLEVEGCPVGLSVVGPPGSDEALLAWAVGKSRDLCGWSPERQPQMSQKAQNQGSPARPTTAPAPRGPGSGSAISAASAVPFSATAQVEFSGEEA